MSPALKDLDGHAVLVGYILGLESPMGAGPWLQKQYGREAYDRARVQAKEALQQMWSDQDKEDADEPLPKL